MYKDDLTLEELLKETDCHGVSAWLVQAREYAEGMANETIAEYPACVHNRSNLLGAFLVRHQRILVAARRLGLLGVSLHG